MLLVRTLPFLVAAAFLGRDHFDNSTGATIKCEKPRTVLRFPIVNMFLLLYIQVSTSIVINDLLVVKKYLRMHV